MLSEADRAMARQVAASLPPLTDRQRDALASLLQPVVWELRLARRRPKAKSAA